MNPARAAASARAGYWRLPGQAYGFPGARLADDFTAVPAEEWWRIRQAVRDLTALSMLSWVALTVLVLILFRKGIISLADFHADG